MIYVKVLLHIQHNCIKHMTYPDIIESTIPKLNTFLQHSAALKGKSMMSLKMSFLSSTHGSLGLFTKKYFCDLHIVHVSTQKGISVIYPMFIRFFSFFFFFLLFFTHEQLVILLSEGPFLKIFVLIF